MKAIIRNGKVLPVDDMKIDKNDYVRCIEPVVMIDDGVHLDEMFLACGYVDINKFDGRRSTKLEYKCEKIFDHKPTETELIYFMAENNLTCYDFCTIEKVYQLDD